MTASVPPTSTSAVFSSIFSRRANRKNQSSDDIYAISSVVDSLSDNLNSPFQAQRSHQTTPEDLDLHATISQEDSSINENTSSQNSDSMQSGLLHVNVQELVKHFRPFAPPPPPVAMSSAEAKAKRVLRVKPTIKSYSATLTILESTHPNGSKIYHTLTSAIREDPLPPSTIIEEGQATEPPSPPRQPFLCHMRERQRRWEGIRNRHGEPVVWRAISVRRQRKLKMKKHKYRKFMRRTRNLRKRLDRN